MKKILKVLLYVFASITFIFNWSVLSLVFWDNTGDNLGAHTLSNITIRQFWIILCWLVSVYILTNFLKSDTKDKENEPK